MQRSIFSTLLIALLPLLDRGMGNLEASDKEVIFLLISNFTLVVAGL